MCFQCYLIIEHLGQATSTTTTSIASVAIVMLFVVWCCIMSIFRWHRNKPTIGLGELQSRNKGHMCVNNACNVSVVWYHCIWTRVHLIVVACFNVYILQMLSLEKVVVVVLVLLILLFFQKQTVLCEMS